MAVITPLTGSDLPSTPTAGDVMGSGGRRPSPVDRVYGFVRAIPTIVLWLIVVVWSIPTLGLFVNSWRSRDAQKSTGW
jgi:alpha-glucoside transport system permease protein